jgi:hypothetical protein
MSNQGKAGGPPPDSLPDNGMPGNPLGNVSNILGFLLASFGGFLGFLGIRSAEVTTVLRNDTKQASLIALLLLLGILAAVLAATTDNAKKASLRSVVAIIILLSGAGASATFSIPAAAPFFTLSRVLSLGIGIILVLTGTAILVAGSERLQARWTCKNPDQPERGLRGLLRELPLEGRVSRATILIMASVILTAASAYGAMRLESDSQLSFTAQVGAQVSQAGSRATISVHVTASKIAKSDWLDLKVSALPRRIDTASKCSSVHPLGPSCLSDPCFYFGLRQYAYLDAKCTEIINGTLAPSATGEVDETLSSPFVQAEFQDLDVYAYICSPQSCRAAANDDSRFDFLIPSPSLN